METQRLTQEEIRRTIDPYLNRVNDLCSDLARMKELSPAIADQHARQIGGEVDRLRIDLAEAFLGDTPMNNMNPKITAYIGKAKKWREETIKLRTIILDCHLTEEFKWGKPCYTFRKSNVIVIQGFKAYCALLFFKGVLLRDPHHILLKTGENTRVGRQIRFTSVQQVVDLETTLKAYIQHAIELEKSGAKVNTAKSTELMIPQELQNKWDKTPALKAAFAALTPGRQRAYVFYFSAAKQSKTRESRVEKCVQRILEGKGLDD